MDDDRDGVRAESDEEVLQGAYTVWERLAARPGLVRWLAVGAVVLLTATLTVVHLVRPGTAASRFRASVVSASYTLPASGGIDSTLVIGNPTPAAVTLTGVTLGNPGPDTPAAGAAIVVLGLSPGGRGTVTVVVHSDFDCAAGHSALPEVALLTGADSGGRPGTVEVRLPGSGQFSAQEAGFRDRVCAVAYPLTSVEVGYRRLGTIDGERRRFGMELTVAAGDEADAVRVERIGGAIPGVAVAMDPTGSVELKAGVTQEVGVVWTVTDCRAVPRYYGIPSVTVQGANIRATETRAYALGVEFDHDLARALAEVCPAGGG